MNKTFPKDIGSSNYTAVRSLVKYGSCLKKLHGGALNGAPSTCAYYNASNYKIKKYLKVKNSLESFKSAICNNMPVIMGMYVKESFMETTNTGIVIDDNDSAIIGGHSVICFGYDNQYIYCLNSWGSSWGDRGKFYLPHSYFRLISDCWVIIA